MAVTEDKSLNRRSANYAPPLWSFDHVQSLSSKYTGEDYEARVDSLKKSVKTMIQEVVGNPLKTLELVDNLQRLGISYHFEEEISQVLEMIYNDYYKTQEQWNGMDMNLKALGFRLLRQHGHHVPQEMFLNFKVKAENDKPQSDEDNNHVVGMLNLYEASYHSFEDESILDDARDFTTKYLKESVDRIDGSSSLGSLINHALELPLHWRIARLEAKWFIEAYREIVSPTLMELAILDFNMVQAINLQDLKESSRWWRNTCWDKKLSFSRDRLVEGYMWTIGVWSLPNFSLGRRTLTKVNAIITAIDDIYDIYGTLDELQQFTDVITRWDINAVEELPDYMKICFLGSFNVINEMAYNTLANSNSGVFILPYLKKAWVDLCNAYLLEAQWYQSGYIPTLEEYLHNASVSISVPVGLMHCNFLTSNYTSTQEIQQCIQRSANIVHYSALILRLADDLGTSSDEMARGDNPKSIQCYMHETGATEDEARNYMKSLINKTWKKLTKERAGAAATCEFLMEFECATNLARMAPFMYSQGDGYGRPQLAKSNILSLLFNPIQDLH
ncbi:R-linalool synthase QH1, chloroplastic-like [Cynara cardunculus var. scolymus]|uniref:R-linalool synthase QH1, chloroplastic-like n=1 Tax=Cynara cardunculus var. scolymus TaxID=59895 RepID=UPI000D62991C|nr:R-linalool synthase QH1, chloroplastic-like [Cynara cardunculus var. scolymus]